MTPTSGHRQQLRKETVDILRLGQDYMLFMGMSVMTLSGSKVSTWTLLAHNVANLCLSAEGPSMSQASQWLSTDLSMAM